ncbi:MAG: dTDP-4-dehydrorhamnose reductase [Candidatus Omnitrophota bacterium]
MLGSKLCEALADEYEAFGLDLLKPQLSTLNPQHFIQCDITDKDKVAASINKVKPDLIIHAAAYTDVDGCELNPEKAFAVNAKGTENIAQAAKESDAALFYISTDYVFDGKKDKPYTEADAPNPINIYGKSKLEGEKAVRSLLDKYFILRTSWLFGPGGKNFVTTILNKAGESRELRVVDDQIGSPTYTLDLADAVKNLLSMLAANLYGIYHITNGGGCSWCEFAKKIVLLSNLKTQILPITSEESNRPAPRPKMSLLDNSKLIVTFKLRLRPWQEALRDFMV